MTAPLTARPPAGAARGALAGSYPAPALSAVSAGLVLRDDFFGNPTKTFVNTELPWVAYDYGGGVTVSASSGGVRELGVVRLSTAAGLNDGGTIAMPTAIPGGIPEGLEWACKLSATTASDQRTWSGFASATDLDPLVVGPGSFVGVRGIVTGAGPVNWYGVAKTGVSSETTVDLGVAMDATWRWFGFKRTTTGLQFYTIEVDRLYGPTWTAVGTEIPEISLPTADLYPVGLGTRNATAAVKRAEIDYWGCGGLLSR